MIGAERCSTACSRNVGYGMQNGDVSLHESHRMPAEMSAIFRQKLSVQLVSTSTKSRWKFYTQVRRRSFHTAWTHTGSRDFLRAVAITSQEIGAAAFY